MPTIAERARNLSRPAAPLAVRWTIGDVSPAGFEA